MTNILESLSCCGVREIAGLKSQPHKTMWDVCFALFEEDCGQAFLLITDTCQSQRGRNFVKYIKSNKLGDVVETKWRKNPNSGHRIKVWVWAPNEKRLQAWWDIQ